VDRQEALERFNDPAFRAELRRRKDEDFRDSTMQASDVFRLRLRDLRAARGMTQADLAVRMRATGNPMSMTAIQKVEAGQRGISLDEAFALTEALQGVPSYMLTPPGDKLIRLSEGLATDGAGLRQWLVSGLPFRSKQDPPSEIEDDVRSERLEANLVRLARGLIDATRIDGDDGRLARKAAVRALCDEAIRT
jgi:transcriptional regulator with XRE-family HTH domain